MRVSREKAAENRERIIEAAGALFRSKGFGGIGVADIMKAADLTHGGFYGQFDSKDDLVTQVSKRVMARAKAKWEKIAADAGQDTYAALLASYLSSRHRDHPDSGCIFSALGVDAARGGKAVRDAFADGLDDMLDILAAAVPRRGQAARRRKAVASMAGLVGAIILSRAVGNASLSNEILDATHRELAAAA